MDRAAFQPSCKVCDRGTLVKKKLFRMSGPVVAIGFILLIPSILGMTVSASMFLENAKSVADKQAQSNTLAQPVPPAEPFDDVYLRGCANGLAHGETPPSPMPVAEAERLCECTLSEMKAHNDVSEEQEEQYDRLLATTPLTVPAAQQDSPNPSNPLSDLVHGVTGGLEIVMGIASFVGGLFGWLLIMKKRVLQCSVCNATVSAS
jgi:hypothetical protein